MYDSNRLAAGLQVAEYMEEMQEDSEENYNKHFSAYIDAEVEGGELEELLQAVCFSVSPSCAVSVGVCVHLNISHDL